MPMFFPMTQTTAPRRAPNKNLRDGVAWRERAVVAAHRRDGEDGGLGCHEPEVVRICRIKDVGTVEVTGCSVNDSSPPPKKRGIVRKMPRHIEAGDAARQ